MASIVIHHNVYQISEGSSLIRAGIKLCWWLFDVRRGTDGVTLLGQGGTQKLQPRDLC